MPAPGLGRGACAGGAAINVAVDVGVDVLGGRKVTLGGVVRSAATGCVLGVVGLGAEELLESVASVFVRTPYGLALQSMSPEALRARAAVRAGALMYRGGRLGRSAAAEGQFWALESPLSPGYAQHYGLPPQNATFDFVEVGVLRPGARFITRAAPGIGTNPGGGIEAVVDAGSVILKAFTMP